MPTLRTFAKTFPDKIAGVIAETGEAITYSDLDRRSCQLAQWLIASGLNPGDGIAILLGNDLAYLEIVWGARRAGLYYTPISTHLKSEEAAFIVRDSGAKMLFASQALGEIAQYIASDETISCAVVAIDGADIARSSNYRAALARFDGDAELPDCPVGADFFYSSGTTGRPKGIKQPLHNSIVGARATANWASTSFQLDADTIYLSTAPLYHGAPLRYCVMVTDNGGTIVIMKKFSAEAALRAIEVHRVTHSQWVPTMFFRLLALPDPVRAEHDLSSHRVAVHAAAPCPVEIKQRMIDWWGPIVWEYYAASEKNGATRISSEEWLVHRGSVGKACLGTIHILDADQNQLPVGAIGDIYFDGPKFAYHNDPEKTAAAYSRQGWSTVGDVGYLDDEGYLYLTDRRSHMIISGGVNIYPAEIENTLLLHPAVQDVAVFGIPNTEFGEEVIAVVALRDSLSASPELSAELIAYCKSEMSSIKCPRSIVFDSDLPRQDNGKLFKHVIRQRFLP